MTWLRRKFSRLWIYGTGFSSPYARSPVQNVMFETKIFPAIGRTLTFQFSDMAPIGSDFKVIVNFEKYIIRHAGVYLLVGS